MTSPLRPAQYLGIVAVALAIHVQALAVPFHFDDWPQILESEGVAGASPVRDLLRDILHPLAVLNRPLTTATYKIDWSFWAPAGTFDPDSETVMRGVPALGLHVTQWLLAGVLAALAAAFLARLGAPAAACAAGALAVAVHPLSAHAVCYLSARGSLLAAIGMLMALCGACGRAGRALSPGDGAWWIAGCLVAAYAKPDGMVAAPVSLLAFTALRLPRRGLPRTFFLYALAAAGAVAVIGIGLWIRELQEYLAKGFAYESLARQARVRPAVAARYLGWIAFPIGLTVDPAFPTAAQARPAAILGALVLGAAGALRLRAARETAAFLLLAWAPSLLIPLQDPGFPQRAVIGLPALAWFAARAGPRGRRLLTLAIVPWACWTAAHEATWRNGQAVWSEAVLSHPLHPRPHDNTAWYDQRRGAAGRPRLARSALRAYRLAHESPYGDARQVATSAHYLGNLAAEQERYRDAIAYYEESLAANPGQEHVVRALAIVRGRLAGP